MKHLELETFALDNFEGPIEFLLHLIQKNEIDIYEVSLRQITEQYLGKLKEMNEPDVETGAEFIGTTALLVWLKSRMLLPKHEQPLSPEEEIDPRFEIIHQLLEYCRFKEAAKELAEREQKQSSFFGRGLEGPMVPPKNLGIEHLTLQDLAGIFKEIIAKAESKRGLIHEEEWRVSDKILLIRDLLLECGQFGLHRIFSSDRSREELIVTFLAVLELMKIGDIKLVREQNEVVIISHG